jgi:hypothetical protein
MIPILPWCTLGDPLPYIAGSYHKATTLSESPRVHNYVSVTFDISKKKAVSELKRPHDGKVWILLCDTCTLSYSVICRQLLNMEQRIML